MELDKIFMNSFEYSKSNWTKVAILGAIILVTFILWILGAFLAGIINNSAVSIILFLILAIITIIAAVLYLGYVFRVFKISLTELCKLPEFDDFLSMIVDGLKVLVVWIVYAIIFGIIIAIIWGIVLGIGILIGGLTGMFSSANYLANPSLALGSGIILWILYLIFLIAYLISIALTVLFAIVVPLGITNMAREDNIGAAFNFSSIRERINRIRWLKAVLWVIGLYFFAGLVVGLVSGILVYLLIGFIVVPLLVIPFVSIFSARAATLLYLEGE